MTDSIAASNDNAAEASHCDHHWVSSSKPGLEIWIVQCSLCGDFNAKDMQMQIDSSPRPFERKAKPITREAIRSHLRAAAELNNRILAIREETSPFVPLWIARSSLELEWARTLAAVMQAEQITKHVSGEG